MDCRCSNNSMIRTGRIGSWQYLLSTLKFVLIDTFKLGGSNYQIPNYVGTSRIICCWISNGLFASCRMSYNANGAILSSRFSYGFIVTGNNKEGKE